jgi:hypothetical protein
MCFAILQLLTIQCAKDCEISNSKFIANKIRDGSKNFIEVQNCFFIFSGTQKRAKAECQPMVNL